MRVHLIKKQSIEDFCMEHSNAVIPFRDWLAKIKWADWNKPRDIQQTFPAADLLGKNTGRVIFNIGGNSLRMICKYVFGGNEIHLYVCWIGTHAEYTKLCMINQQYTICKY